MKKYAYMILFVSFIGIFIFGPKTYAQQNLAQIYQIGDEYCIKIGEVEILINPSIGGRITALKIAGRNFFTDSTVNDFNWGSSFWLSPQSDWKWPPAAEIDNAPYYTELTGRTLVMKSNTDPRTGLFVTKRIKGVLKENYISIEYEISNSSDSVRKVAPWEVTRVHTNGLSFFPKGEEDSLRGGLAPLMKLKSGILWFQYNEKELPLKGDRQLYTDGYGGWFAQVNNGMIFVKKFPDISFREQAPKEGEVELYVSPVEQGHSYMEIEHQGAYLSLTPGESLTWKMIWYLRKLPSDIKVEIGNQKLVKFVKKVLAD